MLELKNISAGYGDLKVLFDVSFSVGKGEVVSLVGSNGAGKTTILRIISGLVPITFGSVTFKEKDLTKLKSYKRAGIGISHIPQGRGILGTLTTKENLLMGIGVKKMSKDKIDDKIREAFALFPILEERQNQLAGSLSGGQQQMLAIARALMMDPELLILDEPSLGLAPIVVEEVFNIIAQVAQKGMSILIVEQNLVQALAVAQRGLILETGRIVMEGGSEDLLNNESVKEAYLGI